jgi:hypothetical protein
MFLNLPGFALLLKGATQELLSHAQLPAPAIATYPIKQPLIELSAVY